MTRLDRQGLALALLLAAMAGFVDVIAFLALGGFFASFMSGNSTRLAIGIVDDPPAMRVALSLILAFLGGVVGATLAARFATRSAVAGGRHQPAILALVTMLLGTCAMTASQGAMAPLLLLAAAMGAVNTLFERDGEVAVALTYMTGNLVRLGQAIAAMLTGSGDVRRLATLGTMWASFLIGGLAGALSYRHLALDALWVAAGLSATLMTWTLLTGRRAA